jgi:hypothetical protein
MIIGPYINEKLILGRDTDDALPWTKEEIHFFEKTFHSIRVKKDGSNQVDVYFDFDKTDTQQKDEVGLYGTVIFFKAKDGKYVWQLTKHGSRHEWMSTAESLKDLVDQFHKNSKEFHPAFPKSGLR